MATTVRTIDGVALRDVVRKFRDNNAFHTDEVSVKFLKSNDSFMLINKPISDPNTIYVISYNYSLANTTLNIPENCVLFFTRTGKFSTGKINLNNTAIYGTECFSSSITLQGTASNIDINWYNDDFAALKNCLALADKSTHVLNITRDLSINYTETIVTSSLIDFRGHKLSFSMNKNLNPRLFTFTNTESSTLTLGTDKELLLELINSGRLTDYPDKYRNCIIDISSTIKEMLRYSYSNVNITETLYVDEYGDLHGHVWNKDIPNDTRLTIRLHKKTTNATGLKNCNIELTYNSVAASVTYVNFGLQFYRCVNPVLENVTLFSPNILENIVRVDGVILFDCAYNVNISGLKSTSTSVNKNNVQSSYGIRMDRIVNGLISDVKANSMNNYYVWGICASNYLYNIRFDHCNLSRIDTHWRTVNMDIDHCDIGYHGVLYTGRGTINITKSSFLFYGLRPREEFGTYFDGVINITDCYFRRKQTRDYTNVVSGGLIHIAPYVANYGGRGIDVMWMGARQINIKNIYIDIDDNEDIEPNIIGFSSINPLGYDHFEKFAVPDINIENVTYKCQNKRATSAIYSMVRGIEFINSSKINVSNCNDIFSYQVGEGYAKMNQLGLATYDPAMCMFKADVHVKNCNMYTGQEPAEWVCKYTDCIIEGFRTSTNEKTVSTKSFFNCLFRYSCDKKVTNFTRLNSLSYMRLAGCVFDAPVNEDYNQYISTFFEPYDIDDKWSVCQSLSDRIMMIGCLPTEKLCSIIGKRQSDFVNVNSITKD